MALSKTTRILALFILGLSVACVALLVSLVIKTNNSSESGMNVYLFGNLSVEEKTSIKFLGPDNVYLQWIVTVNQKKVTVGKNLS